MFIQYRTKLFICIWPLDMSTNQCLPSADVQPSLTISASSQQPVNPSCIISAETSDRPDFKTHRYDAIYSVLPRFSKGQGPI